MEGEATMYTVEIYENAVELAESLGYEVRHENLGGVGGGACEVAGRKCLFIDLSLSPVDQLDQLTQLIGQDPAVFLADVPPHLRRALGMRDAA